MEYYINVSGGLGYNLSLLRVLNYLKQKKPEYKFSVCSPYWDIFASASCVDTYYKGEEFRDFIFDAKEKNAKIIVNRLYDDEDFIYKRVNYSQAWFKLLGVKETLPDEDIKGNGTSLTLNLDRIFSVFPDVEKHKDKVLQELKGKPFIMVQFWGGQSPLAVQQNYSYVTEPLHRAYPAELAQSFVNSFKETNPGIEIIQYTLPNEPHLKNCLTFEVPYIVYHLLSKEDTCRGFVSIDSSLQHLVSGNCPGIVLWGHTLPTSFGYTMNQNVIQKCRRDDILYFTQLGASGAKIDYIEPEKLSVLASNMVNNTKEEA